MRPLTISSGAAITIIVLFAGACFAELSTARGGSKVAGRFVIPAAASFAPENATVIEELLHRTKSKGPVRVIVQFRISPGPDETREQRIQTTLQSLLDDIAHTPHRILRVYTSIPAAALEASHEALQVLSASPHVIRVDEDKLAKPF